MYRTIGFAHASAYHHLQQAKRRLGADDGQGTVEYIGLILLLAAVMGVVATRGNGTSIGSKIVSQIGKAIDDVSSSGK
jgi:hypothetical protein